MMTSHRRGMTRQRVIVLIIGGVLTAALMAVLALSFAMRKPLAGEMHHDFGLVEIPGEGITTVHVFELTNQTDELVRIAHMIPSCGCTRAEASTQDIPPGEGVSIETAFALSRSGHSKSHVDVFLENGEMLRLSLEAVGKRLNPFEVSRESVRLRATRPTILTIWTEVFDGDDRPAAVEVSAPDDVEARWDGWRQTRESSRAERTPSRWQSQLSVSVADEAALRELAANPEATVQLRWEREDGEVAIVNLPINPVLPPADVDASAGKAAGPGAVDEPTANHPGG